jgi:hypothetical protein
LFAIAVIGFAALTQGAAEQNQGKGPKMPSERFEWMAGNMKHNPAHEVMRNGREPPLNILKDAILK